MIRVYILSSYDEYGAEMVRATLDPERLMDMLPGENLANHRAKVKELVASGELFWKSGENLSDGWGGIQLHIVELGSLEGLE